MEDLAKEVSALRAEMDDLRSREVIRQQLTRYGRGQEWLDETLLQEVFWDDADVDFGFFELGHSAQFTYTTETIEYPSQFCMFRNQRLNE